jgi:methionyl-tRNA synthetase
VNRVLTLAENSKLASFSGKKELEDKINIIGIEQKMEKLDLHGALDDIMTSVRYCNKYINDKKPWTLEGKELEEVLYNLLEAIRISNILLYPFIPTTSDKIIAKLGTEKPFFIDCKFRKEFNDKLTKGDLLFKKVE